MLFHHPPLRPHSCLLLMLLLAVTTACEHTIDYDYPELAEQVLVIEGSLTNEGAQVRITWSRPMTQALPNGAVDNATVTIADDAGHAEKLHFTDSTGCYTSATGLVGQVGHTYRLTVLLDGHEYSATSTMPPPAPITETQFRWLDIVQDRILHLDLTAVDPQPDTLNYYWYRMMRGDEVYRWNAIDDRGCPPGLFVRDIICMAEGMAREKNSQYRDRVLCDGDTIRLDLLTIDRPTFDYLQSLLLSNQTTANPLSNISGGCHGFFTAASITHTDTIFFRYDEVLVEE